MSENKTYTESDIHYFTCSEGRKWAHMPWGMITGEIPDGVIYPAGVRPDEVHALSCWVSGNRSYTYPTQKQDNFAIISADRIEVVTEHVEATVMDALDALRANGGKPVEGWIVSCQQHLGCGVRCSLAAAVPGQRSEKFLGRYDDGDHEWTEYAYRPVTRVRIKPEVKPEPGYGFTLDGNPVPPPPEGWEIVPEGESVPESEHMYFPSLTGYGWREANVFLSDESGRANVVNEAGFLTGIRAYARRVATAPATAEESSGVGASSVAPTLLHTNYASIGLTKREAFAMAAMQGLLADSELKGPPEHFAAAAVTFADALLAELEKGKEAK